MLLVVIWTMASCSLETSSDSSVTGGSALYSRSERDSCGAEDEGSGSQPGVRVRWRGIRVTFTSDGGGVSVPASVSPPSELWSVERVGFVNRRSGFTSGLSPDDSPDPSPACCSLSSRSVSVIFWVVLGKISGPPPNPSCSSLSWMSSRGSAPDEALLSGRKVIISGELASTSTDGVTGTGDVNKLTESLFRTGRSLLESEPCVTVVTSAVGISAGWMCPLCSVGSSGSTSSEALLGSSSPRPTAMDDCTVTPRCSRAGS